jgi:hypothetical protein
MGVIAAGVVTKTGRILVARCFMDVTRIRIEGLLSAFPKLLGTGTGKQTTFIDSGSVRYLYQPVEGMYLLTVTTKTSNIMEDLATLRTLGRLLPEYCSPITEDTVVAKAFEIMFAMDEIITNGAREATTMEQVLTAIEMRSEAEERAQREQQEKEKEAKKVAKAKAKEMKQRRMDNEMFSGGGGGNIGGGGYSGGGGIDSSASTSHAGRFAEVASAAETEQSKAPGKKLGGGGMSLSNKRKTDQAARVLAETGAAMPAKPAEVPAAAAASALPETNDYPVNIRIDEKVSVSLNRDGGITGFSLNGDMSVVVTDTSAAEIRIRLNPLNADCTYRSHPNINKPMFTSNNILASKDGRPFPLQSALGILKWSSQGGGKGLVPVSFAFWPSDNGVTIEYELTQHNVTLENVVVAVPVGGSFPTVNEVTVGDYTHDSAASVVQWRIGTVSADNASGSIEISLEDAVGEDAFFPAQVYFSSNAAISGTSITAVERVDNVSVEAGIFARTITESFQIA